MSILWKNVVRPAAFALDAERAHELGLTALERGLASPFYSPANIFPELATELFGLKFANPLGVAAGFDKNAKVAKQLYKLGFGFVEVGTVTERPQAGNPKPRMFRLPDDRALINRLGFNNDGAAAVAKRLERLQDRNFVIGVNIGKNKDVPNDQAVGNYLAAFDAVQPFADYIAVNISSPNTPGLRDLQQSENLHELLSNLQSRNRELGAKPLLVKVAPDLTDAAIDEAVDVCLRNEVSGIIATNTTVSRDGLRSGNFRALGEGGLSGAPLRARSTAVISQIRRATQGTMPILGVGGIFDAADALEKIKAGASLVQAYTGFVYGGPGFASDLLRQLAAILKRDGFESVTEAVGTAVQ